jgi:hypothetical protein
LPTASAIICSVNFALGAGEKQEQHRRLRTPSYGDASAAGTRTFEPSNLRTFEPSNPRTLEPSNPRTLACVLPDMTNSFSRVSIVVALAGMTVAGCSSGPVRTVTRSVDVGSAKSVDVDVNFGAGELRLAGGAPALLDARFEIAGDDPAVNYAVNNGEGRLTVQPPSGSATSGGGSGEWHLRLQDGVPINLKVSTGAGETHLDLGTLDLGRLEINQGVGELHVDLRGMPRRSFEIDLHGAVGEAHIRLPRSVGIIATATTGVGELNVAGLEKNGDTWINPGHENDAVVIRLNARGDVGEINISADD